MRNADLYGRKYYVFLMNSDWLQSQILRSGQSTGQIFRCFPMPFYKDHLNKNRKKNSISIWEQNVGGKKLQILYSGVKALCLLKYCFDWKVEDNRQRKKAHQILLGSAPAIRCNLGGVMFYALFKYTVHQRHWMDTNW